MARAGRSPKVLHIGERDGRHDSASDLEMGMPEASAGFHGAAHGDAEIGQQFENAVKPKCENVAASDADRAGKGERFTGFSQFAIQSDVKTRWRHSWLGRWRAGSGWRWRFVAICAISSSSVIRNRSRLWLFPGSRSTAGRSTSRSRSRSAVITTVICRFSRG